MIYEFSTLYRYNNQMNLFQYLHNDAVYWLTVYVWSAMSLLSADLTYCVNVNVSDTTVCR